MHNISIIGLFSPLLSSVLLVAFSSKINRALTGFLACFSLLISFACFAFLFSQFSAGVLELGSVHLFSWIPIDGINADFSLYIDSLSLLMSLVVTGVGFLIHVYANGYMDHEEDFARFFACLNFFIFAMLLLVLAQHLLVLFIGWEGVGIASYLLIGFWYNRSSATKAASKAFIVNRIGDVGLLLGILLTAYTFGTTDIPVVLEKISLNFSAGSPVLVALALLFFIGACGKSAQVPLHIWLPDAMEGPTPVSALIHAATMVTAGVYLVARLHPLYLMTPDVLQLMGIIGGITSFFAALCAAGQTDLKRVLAYSTLSQLGLMFVACGVGSFYAAIFHLTTHAFAKALLFLCAGNVVHMLHGETNMNNMGGLAKKLPQTHALFALGVLAMAGIPPLALFFSKDLIIEQSYQTHFYLLFYLCLATSLLTAYYLTRAYLLTFRGLPAASATYKNLKEAPNVMIIPSVILALLTAGGGLLGLTFADRQMPMLESFLLSSGITLANYEHSQGFHLSAQILIVLLIAMSGIAAAFWGFSRQRERFSQTINLLLNAFYLDELYAYAFVLPLKKLAHFIGFFSEQWIFSGSIELVTKAISLIAGFLQRWQNGQIRSYVAGFLIGAAALIFYFSA